MIKLDKIHLRLEWKKNEKCTSCEFLSQYEEAIGYAKHEVKARNETYYCNGFGVGWRGVCLFQWSTLQDYEENLWVSAYEK